MPRDNILLITTDQQRFDTIQALGNRHIFTPHLNYLVGEGISFTRSYADCPVCVPSRTTIMTGKTGYESGVVSNATHRSFMETQTASRSTLPAVLTDCGYQTKAVGKMHFDPARACYGFESMELPLDYMREYDGKRDTARPKAHGVGECEMEPVISTVDTKDSLTTWITDRSCNFLETRDPLRPFFLWASFTKPHPPFDPCRDYWLLYETGNMPDPITGDWSATLEGTPQGFLAGSYENTNMHLFGPEQLRASKRAYYAMITQLDYSLGLLFGCLREQGLFEDTWIVFTSDHGEMLGDHHMSQKNLFFEGSSHIPLIIVPPKRLQAERNVRSDTLAQMADLYPTILEMAGITPKDEGVGKSLLQPLPERIFFGDTLHRHFCVMKDKVKLVYTSVGGHALLFDLESDPMEQRDLSGDPAWQGTFRELWGILLDKVRETNPQLLNRDEFILSEEPRFPGDIPGHWFGFHYKDYSVDTFH
ncbi:MAG: sulfatase-like hydrolase/transferase [Oscillospiraceae bacterium]